MPSSVGLAVAASACVFGGDPPFRHLCRGWIPTEAEPEHSGNVYAVASVDPDGPGPKKPMLLFGTRAWDGHRYQSYPTGHVDDIRAMLWADLDGPGPGTTQLYGCSIPTATYERGRVYRFTGNGWVTISDVSDAWPAEVAVNALAAFDPDGGGPLSTGLYVGGSFTTPGAYLMRWDGNTWSAVPADPLTAPVRALAVFDPDGSGPLAARLVIGGSFQNAGSASGDFIVQWTGSSWLSLGTGLDGECAACVVFDPDGAGPLPARLIVGGSFTTAGGQPAAHIAQWNGTAWSALGAGVNGPVESLQVVDPDGPGPLSPRLLVGGNFTTAGGLPAPFAAQWNGSSWSNVGAVLDAPVYGATLYDPDDDGPVAPALAVGGTFSTVGGVELGDPVMWDGTEWFGITDALNDTGTCVVLFDPDGPGGEPPRPVAGGYFTRAGNLPCNYIAQRVGMHWRPMGDGMDAPVAAVTVYNGAVIVGGYFTVAGGVTAPYIARWDGSSWSALGAGLDGPVYALATFDPDGPGPLAPRLAVGGEFSAAGGQPASNIAVWDGTSWSTLGLGVDGPVVSIATYDPDGDGPSGDVVAVAGEFATAGGAPMAQAALWNGSGWTSLGQPPGVAINALTACDLDGAGPTGGTLFAGGQYATGAGFVVEQDSGQWYYLGFDFDGPVRALICMDPDDAEFLPPVLIAGGEFSYNSSDFTRGVASWSGEFWENMAGGVDGVALGFGVGFDHDGPTGLATHPILTVGTFTSTGQKPGDHFGLYSFGGEPSVPLPPRDTVGHFGGSATLRIEAEGLLPVVYHWLKGDEFISDGITPEGATRTGTNTDTLTISNLSAADAGPYNCYVTSACGNSFSTSATLTVTCAADFNGDGFVDGIDYDQFNNAFEAGDLAADYNNDGFIDGIDYDQFNNDFETGC